MLDRTNTTAMYERPPEGRWEFEVSSKPEKVKAGKTTVRKWKFRVWADRERRLSITFFPWDSRELLLALGGKLEGQDVIWDDDQVEGLKFKANLNHTSRVDKSGKKWDGCSLTEIEAVTPF